MDLKTRLSRLQTQAGVTAATPRDKLSGLRERIAELERSRRGHASAAMAKVTAGAPVHGAIVPAHAIAARAAAPAAELVNALDGEEIAPGLIRIHRRIALSGAIGDVPLHSLRGDPRLPGEPEDARRRVYIDTETTGLSGGSGTLAFLIGIASVEAGTIELTQFLLTGFGAEASMLSAFTACLSADDRLISYNGKSYDLPLLITRYRMHGMTHPFDALPHLDLLHPVRRLFGRRWPDCRLTSVERELLGFRRVDDLPGSEAPEAWFSYIRFGQAAQLLRVVEHNRQDIVSLAVAHSSLSEAIARPRAYDVDIHALARWLAERSEDEARALLKAHEDALCGDGRRLHALLSRRAGDWQQAVAIWETLAAGGCTDSMECLAKYHEHVSKDLHAAQRCCESLAGNAAQHRRARIEGKIHRAHGRQGLPAPIAKSL